MTVAPVVVKPDIDSNHAFTAPRMISMRAASSVNGPTNTPPSQNGSAPMKTAMGQTRATAANASLSRSRSVVSVRVPRLNIKIPTVGESAAGIAKEYIANCQSSNQTVSNPHRTKGNVSAISVQPSMRFSTSKRIFTP